MLTNNCNRGQISRLVKTVKVQAAGGHNIPQMCLNLTKFKGKLLLTSFTASIIVYTLYSKLAVKKYENVLMQGSVPLWEQTLDFEKLNFSNETGNPSGSYIVPNYIHFIYFGGKPITYIQMICILAALKNQNPEKLFFHHDSMEAFNGKYWEILEKLPRFKAVLVFNRVEVPEEIFGQPLSEGWRFWHGSDVMRIQTMIKYGGVYLDSDCYLVQSIDKYRRFEMTLNWDENQFLGSQVLIGHKDARFLKKYLDTYKAYNKDGWYYNAGERPTVEILYKEPELIHRVKLLFGAHVKYAFKMFQEQWEDWKQMYIVHLLTHHQYLFKNLTKTAVFPVEFDEYNIGYYNVTFREMAYDVYDFANVKWQKNRFDLTEGKS